MTPLIHQKHTTVFKEYVPNNRESKYKDNRELKVQVSKTTTTWTSVTLGEYPAQLRTIHPEGPFQNY